MKKTTAPARRLAILGSTGAIGLNALDVVRRFPDRFRVVSLTANRSVKELAWQAREFRPRFVGLSGEGASGGLKAALDGANPIVAEGPDCNRRAAVRKDVDAVLNGLVGMVGLKPTLEAVRAGKDILLANKETLIAGGNLVMREAAARGVRILPIDSEHSALFQLLAGVRPREVRRLILTSSGGPFLNWKGPLANVTAKEALRHPRWKMGPKITVDSATMMNKGLEIIEARWLFDVPAEKIDVVVHPQSLIHSMVELEDGSVLAQAAVTDMRIPIQYAMSWPERLPSRESLYLDFARMESLTFQRPDTARFPCLALGFRCCKRGGSAPAALNAANEAANEAFLKEKIRFTDIAVLIEKTVDAHEASFLSDPTLEEIHEIDRWARRMVFTEIRRMKRFL